MVMTGENEIKHFSSSVAYVYWTLLSLKLVIGNQFALRRFMYIYAFKYVVTCLRLTCLHQSHKTINPPTWLTRTVHMLCVTCSTFNLYELLSKLESTHCSLACMHARETLGQATIKFAAPKLVIWINFHVSQCDEGTSLLVYLLLCINKAKFMSRFFYPFYQSKDNHRSLRNCLFVG